MIRTLFNYSLGLFTLIFSLVQTCEDIPQFDYESHPNQPFDFEHVRLNITLEPDRRLVKGVVTYSISAKVDGISELILQTEESAIDDIFVDEEEVDFRVSNDSLIIQLPNSSEKNEEFELEIIWQSTTKFGLYLDSESNFWSSKNPLSHHHWFPTFDHPRNELTFDATFTIPLETEVLFNGDLVTSEVASATQKKITYSSGVEVPVTGLGFALGDFVITEVASGLTDIRLFSSETGFTEESRIELVREASQLKKDIEKTLSMEYPWEGLNIVALPDNYWEERTHGSGTIFLYENLGSFTNQLKRGLYAQWFGEYLRGEQFFDLESGSDELMRSSLHFSLEEERAMIENPDTLNTIYLWNRWQTSFQKEEELLQNTIKNSLSYIVKNLNGIVKFEDFAEIWYQKTGISWFDFSTEGIEEQEITEEKLVYKVEAFYDEINSNLDVIFELKEGSGEKLYSLNLTEYTFDDTIEHEVNFTGNLDTVSISLSPSIEYFSLEEGSISLEFMEFGEFPLFLLLNQLRSEFPKERAFAAKRLSLYKDNPDLQLALNDVTNQEENIEVQAALLGTMASITNGATGTEQQFLEKLNGDELGIQLASLQALKNYPENDLVKSAIRTKLIRTNVDVIFTEALETYVEIATGKEIISLAQRLERADSTGSKSLKVMLLSVNLDSNEVYIPIAESYLGTGFSYSTQKQALEFLLNFDNDSERWISRLNTLLENPDPRIRYSALSAVRKISTSEAFKLLKSVEVDEFDVRVLLQAENLLEVISE